MDQRSKVLLLLMLSWSTAQGINDVNREAMKETLPLYTVLSNADLLNDTQCRKEMIDLKDAIDDGVLWGLRILDISGEPGSGFTIGNNFWAGSRQACVYINDKRTTPLSHKYLRNVSLYRDPKNEHPPYPVRYYVSRFINNSTQQYHVGVVGEDTMMMGLCLPSSCTVDELTVIVEKIFRDRTLLIGHLYSADFKLVEVSDMVDDHQWLLTGQNIIIIIILFITVGLTVAGTIYDLAINQRRLKKKRDFLTFENNNTAELKNDVENKHEPDPENLSLENRKPETQTGKILMCFSAYTNAKQIFNFDVGSDSLPALHGVKFIGMGWIVFAHAAYYTNNYMANVWLGAVFTDSLIVQAVSNATYSVDTFFCISGFLMGYLYFKLMRKEKPTLSFLICIKQIIMLTIKRLIRLTPTYMVVIMIAILNYTWYDKVSSYTNYEHPSYHCSKYWWRNLLYINNFYPWEELCLSWSWYIANDMQFFLFGTILLMLYTWRPSIAISISGISVLITTVVTGYLVYENTFVPTLDEVHRTLTVLYMRPWLRSGPFLVGLATAVILDKMNYKLHLSTRGRLAGWAFGVFVNCSILFGAVDRNMPMHLSIIYVSLTRTCWGFGVAWLIIACATNNGGIVNKFLSLPIWIPLSRLTLGAYLMNPLLISSMNLFNNYPHFFELLSTGSMAIGVTVVTYVCSTIISLIAEAPAIQILKLLSASQSRRLK